MIRRNLRLLVQRRITQVMILWRQDMIVSEGKKAIHLVLYERSYELSLECILLDIQIPIVARFCSTDGSANASGFGKS